jgi:hypothetical protein
LIFYGKDGNAKHASNKLQLNKENKQINGKLDKYNKLLHDTGKKKNIWEQRKQSSLQLTHETHDRLMGLQTQKRNNTTQKKKKQELGNEAVIYPKSFSLFSL